MATPSKAGKATRRPSRQGIDWHTVPLRVNLCGKTVTPAGWSHHHKYLSSGRDLWHLQDQDLWLKTKGEATWRLGRQTVEAEPGTCLWLRPGMQRELHSRTMTKSACLWIHFDTLRSPRGPAFLPAARDLPPPVVEFVDVDLVATLASRLRELMSPSLPYQSAAEEAAARSAAQVYLRAIILEFLAAARGSGHAEAGEIGLHQRRAVARVASQMHDDPGGCGDLGRLAAAQGYGQRYFARLFKAVTGTSMSEHLVRSRINRARALLAQRDLSIGEVADQLGYRDVYFFSRQFKKYAGCAPGKYRPLR